MNKVTQIFTNFEAKIMAEGVDAQKAREESTVWCNTQSSDVTANLFQLGETLQTKVGNLARSASTTEVDLKADFEQSEKEPPDTIDTLKDAIVFVGRR